MINRNQPRSTGIHITQRKTNQTSQSQMSTLSRFIVGAARLMLVRREMRYSTMQTGYRSARIQSCYCAANNLFLSARHLRIIEPKRQAARLSRRSLRSLDH